MTVIQPYQYITNRYDIKREFKSIEEMQLSMDKYFNVRDHRRNSLYEINTYGANRCVNVRPIGIKKERIGNTPFIIEYYTVGSAIIGGDQMNPSDSRQKSKKTFAMELFYDLDQMFKDSRISVKTGFPFNSITDMMIAVNDHICRRQCQKDTFTEAINGASLREQECVIKELMGAFRENIVAYTHVPLSKFMTDEDAMTVITNTVNITWW